MAYVIREATDNPFFSVKTYLTHEMRYDQLTPILAYKAIAGVGSCMMESAYDEGYGTYSFIGINPVATFTAWGKQVQIKIGKEIIERQEDPYSLLEQFSKGQKVFGFIAYDAVRLKEKLPNRHESQPIPDFLFHIYKTVIRFDHKLHKVTFTHYGTKQELDEIINKIFNPLAVAKFKQPVSLNMQADVNDEEYARIVKKAQEYIKAGDIFQVVLSRTFTATIDATPFDIYRALRQLNPTPYLAFFEEADFAIAGASPELLVGVKNGIIEAVPIAGTCKKGENIEKLLADPKENAEHVMLVDLARNDVGSMAKPGTVRVAEYKSVKSYSHVSHIVSRVMGELDSNYSPLSVLKAMLPAGTLSGAPKIRAMEIIDELEHSKRGLYGGAIVIIDEAGNLTSSIAIRTAVIYGNQVEVRVGAGIVLDSIPQQEAQETKLKLRGVATALELAQGGTQ